MSLEFVSDFFPSSVDLLRRVDILDALFPPHGACSTPVSITFLGCNVRWPFLVPFILIGMGLGAAGTRMSLQLGRPRMEWFEVSFFGYFLMCITALACHCLTKRGSPWHLQCVTWDVMATGVCACSAICAVLGGDLEGAALRERGGNKSTKMGWRTFRVAIVNAGVIFCMAVGKEEPFVREAVYIGSSLVAAVVVGHYVLHRPTVGGQRLWRALLFAGATIALAGVPLDVHLCALFGPHVNHAVLLFAGCDVAILALLMYVRDEMRVRYDAPHDAALRRKRLERVVAVARETIAEHEAHAAAPRKEGGGGGGGGGVQGGKALRGSGSGSGSSSSSGGAAGGASRGARGVGAGGGAGAAPALQRRRQ